MIGLAQVCRGAVWLVASLAAVVFAFVAAEALPLLRVASFSALLGRTWLPGESLYGMSPMLAGSLAATLGAIIVAAPVGIGAAIFVRFYASPILAAVYRLGIELLSAVPSVVFGLWGLVALVPLIGRLHSPGTSLLAAALVLALMIVPTVMITADAAVGSKTWSRWA